MYCPISQISNVSLSVSLAHDSNISEQSVPVNGPALKGYKCCCPAGKTVRSALPKVSESFCIYCKINTPYT